MPPKPPPLPELLARVDALGRVPGVAGIPGAALPPRPTKQQTFPSLPSALPPRPEQTKVGAAGPPAAGSAPSPLDVAPVSATLESNDPQGVPRERAPQGQPEPRTFTPTGLESPARQEAADQELRRQGKRVEPAPVSAPGAPGQPRKPPSEPPVSVSEGGIRVSWTTIRRVLPYLLLGTGGVGGSVLWEKIRTGLDLATGSSVLREAEARKDLEARVAKDAEALARESDRVDALACRLRRQCAALDRLGYRTGSDCQGVEWLSVRLEGDTVRSGPLWRAEGDCPTLPPPKP